MDGHEDRSNVCLPVGTMKGAIVGKSDSTVLGFVDRSIEGT